MKREKEAYEQDTWSPGEDVCPVSSVQEDFQRPLDVHSVTHTSHAQVDQILLLQVGQMAALDIIVHKGIPVLAQV